jgi:hypothetical protein
VWPICRHSHWLCATPFDSYKLGACAQNILKLFYLIMGMQLWCNI